MSTFAEYTKKKKKKDVDASELAKKHSSFRGYTEEVLGVELAPIGSPVKTTVDIAPVKPTVNVASTKPADKITGLMSVYGNKDFATKSGYVSTKSEGIWEKLGSKYGMNYNDLQYEYINNQNDIRKEIDSKAMSWGSDTGKTSSSYKEKALDYMTDDEVAVYNYYYQTEGKDKAQEFLDALAETLNARKAGKDFESIEGKTAREILYGTVAGAEQFKQGVKGFGSMITGKDDYIPQTSTQILTGKIREDLADDGTKVFGNSLGQVVHDALSTGTNMLPSVMTGGVAGTILMGATAAGNAYQQDLNEFGDKEKARIYATTIGALEGTLQHFMGGIGQLGGTSAAISNAVSGVKNGALRFALEYGGKIGSEALEEGLQEVLDPVVKNWTHGTDESVDWENVAYSALLGGLIGGVFGAGEVSSTHLNANENAVVDKVYNDTIAEREADGKKLSQKEKSKIYEETLTKLEKGYIDIDTIESVIGGDTYNSYKAEVDKEAMQEADYKRQEEALNKQLEELKNSANTLGNAQKYQEVENKLAELKKTTENSTNEVKSQLKSQLEAEMLKTVQGTKLAESYNERARRGQNLEVDVESYKSDSAKQTAQNFKDFGVNNTNASHDYLDLVTKVAEDRGHTFKFMTTKQLEESIANGNPYNITEDASKVEAFVSGSTKEIVINMDANKSLTSLVGHEVMHTLEKANSYSDAQNALFEYAKTKGEYEDRWASIQRRYSNLTEEQQMQELTSDLVGDYVFGDSEFISNLSTEKPNIFKKIYNEIKYLWKMATAGSKEARELERVKREFEKIWAEAYNADLESGNISEAEEVSDSEVKFSIREEAPPKETGIAYKVFYVKDGKLYPPMVANPDGADTPMGVWLNADVGKEAAPSKTGRQQVKAGGKGTQGGSGSLAFRPGWHLGDLPRASQFDRTNPETGVKELFPKDFVWAEVEYAKDMDYQEEAMSYGYSENGKFRHAYAGLPRLPENGYYRYRTNPKPDTVPWIITGAMKVNRLLSDAEVNSILEQNGVQPVHRQGGDVGLDQFGFNEDGTIESSDSFKELDGGSVVKYSLATWTEETKENARDNLIKAGHDKLKVDKWIKDVNSVASVIASDKARLDFEAADNQTMLKNNQEYVKTLDASTLCAKRLLYQGTFDAIQHRLPNTMLSSDDLIGLLNMMKKHGKQTPCGVCYVESRRRHLGKFAQEWLNGYEGEYKPNLDEVTTSDGLEALRKSHPDTYNDFVTAMNRKGSANPKVVQLRTEYRNEILSLTPAQIRKIDAIGGLRVQSFSDFETPHLLDMMQAVVDMSSKGLTSQAYTKVPNFAWVFGDTGIKINLSLIADGDGFDADGKLAFSSVEGMDINDAMALRDAYSENVGTIIVGANDKHILACMADDRIDYIIPFHRSGWGSKELEMMGMDSYKDYTYGQNEHNLETGKNVSNLYPPDYWDYNLSGKENAERYLRLCEQTGREPKFSEFLVNNGDGSYSLQPDGSTDGYWKLLIDFKMYDNNGNGVAQQKVQPNFNMTEAMRVLNDYEGGANKLPVANDVVEEFVAQYEGNIAPTSDVRYSIADSDGNQLTKEQQEYFKNSKVRDENGNLMVVYHGSKDYGFTVFDTAKSDDNMSLFFTNDANMANSYVNDKSKLYKTYLNLENPLVVDAKGHRWNQIRLGENTDVVTGKVERFVDLAMRYDVEIDFSLVSENLGSMTDSVEYMLQEEMENLEDGEKSLYTDAEKEELRQLASEIDEVYENWDEEAHLDEDGEPTSLRLYLLDHKLSTKYNTRQIAKIAKDKGHDGVIIENVYDNGKFTSDTGVHGFGNVYIAFESNQVKNVDNTSPTSDKDIRHRLADDSYTSKEYGRHIYAKDVALAPLTEDAPAEESSERITGEDLTKKNAERIRTIQAEIKGHYLTKDITKKEFDEKIAQKESQYESLSRKDTKKAVDLRNQITRLETKRDSLLRSLDDKIERANNRIESIESESRYEKRKTKQNEYRELFGRLMGDTSTWKDKKMGIQYQTNTLRRNLRDIVRDASGKQDIARADAIHDELQGSVNRNEAKKNREANEVKNVFREMKINNAESTYIQMLGELRHNPDTTLTKDVVDEFYKKNKGKIDVQKVDKAIDEARKLYDSLYDRVNAALSEHGFKEMGYRKGYFPHFTDPKQNWLAKLLNWKVNNDEIPTDIAGLTEMFEPQRTWQSFDKHRKTDTTDYNFLKGLDNYVNGSLDWIYHIEDIQKHRAFETEIRYRHSSEQVQKKIDEYRNNPMLSAEEVDTLIQSVLREAKNPLNNFVTDLHTRTNILAGKKSSKDRNMESDFNRHAYSVMTNITNRVTANQVVGSVSSALTNFIPITQSWGQVNPTSSLVGMKKTIQSYMSDDGVVAKSDFLTNRLAMNEALYKDAWDKIGDKVGGLMEIVDNFTSQTVWRSKYHENIKKGMTEAQAIKDADQFAENVIGGRSKGNMPTIFHAKNPVTKMLTAFQLEVANQYGYIFKDMPQDIGKKAIGKLTKGYATMFIGAYAYNALYSSLVGRDAALDPLGIIEDFIRDLGGDDDEEEDVAGSIGGLASNVADEIPFVGGLLGGGRIPISSALPYNASISDAYADVVDKDWKSVLDELSKPLYYGVMPMGGGQIRKTVQGLSMFDKDLPVSGSYTKSGNLRFPVEDTFLNKLQAGVFGQYASSNAREYFDRGQKPLSEKRIQEYKDVDLPISEYWDYTEGLKGLKTLSDKADYINSLDLPIAKKNLLVNNQSEREEPIDLTGFDDEYENFDEFDFAVHNPEKYDVALKVGGYKKYKKITEGMSGMTKLEEKIEYIAGLNLSTEQKNALANSLEDRKEPFDLTGYENYDSYEEFKLATKNPKKYSASRVIGYDDYARYMDEINDIEGEKDSNGKTKSGTQKRNRRNYIFSLDLDFGQKAILYRSIYGTDGDKEEFNKDIVNYLDSRDDISYEEMVEILESLEMNVYPDGRITW